MLLVTTSVVFFGIFLNIQSSYRHQFNLLVRERTQETDRVLRRILELRSSGARIHADDYTRWDEFVAFAHKPDANWGTLYITQNISTFGVDAAWVLDDRYRLIFTANPSENPILQPLPIPLPTLASGLRTVPIRHFYTQCGDEVLELWTSPIHPSEDLDRSNPPSGYYIIGRLWTAARLQDLMADANGDVALVLGRSIVSPKSPLPETGTISLVVPLEGISGEAIAAIDFDMKYPLVASAHRAQRVSLVLMLVSAAITLVIVWFALQRWVGRPLASITGALHSGDGDSLEVAVRRHDEMGHLARLVQEFFRQRRDLIEASEAVEMAARAKSQFLANVSHELRTPMHGILSYARFGLNGAMEASREELLEDFKNIEECGANLLALLNDLLDLAKFEAGRMKLSLDAISLQETVDHAVDEFASLFDERGLAAEVLAPENLAPVYGDRLRITQVLRNLLSNAGKWSVRGGKVTVRIEIQGLFARVIVEDSGPGIPDEDLSAIFDKFVQASRGPSRPGGTGLGLAICREIVEAHAGRIWAENRPEGGARLIFDLPFEGPEVGQEPTLAADASQEPVRLEAPPIKAEERRLA
jgi:signal transduction histidine kinase